MSAKQAAYSQIAHDALEYMEMARRAISHMETLFVVASDMAEKSPRLQNLLDMGWHYSCDAAGNASANIDEIGRRLTEAVEVMAPATRVKGDDKP